MREKILAAGPREATPDANIFWLHRIGRLSKWLRPGGQYADICFYDRLPKRDTAKRQTLNGQGRQTAAPRKRGVAFPTCPTCTVRVSPAPHNSIPLPLQDNSITLAPFWISPSTTPIHEPIHSFRICAGGGGSRRLRVTCYLSRVVCRVPCVTCMLLLRRVTPCTCAH